MMKVKASNAGRVTELMQQVDDWRQLIRCNAADGTVRAVVIRAPSQTVCSEIELEQHEAHDFLLYRLQAAEDELRALGVIIE